MESTPNVNKRNLIASIIVTLALVIIGVSASYAYFVNAVSEVNPENKGVRITSGELTMNFETSRTISNEKIGLVKDEDILTDAPHTDFSVTLPSSSKVDGAKYNLYLTDTTMSSNFKSTYLKWALYNGETKIKNGDFSGVELGDEVSTGVYSIPTVELVNDVTLAKGDTNSYKLYIWLSYDADNRQNDLLEGTLSTKVGFRAVSN